MADEHITEYSNGHEYLGSKSTFVDAEFVEYDRTEPCSGGDNEGALRDEQSKPDIEVVDGEIVENEPLSPPYEERVLFQVHHRDSGSDFIVTASSIGEAMSWLYASAEIMAEAHLELGPVQEGLEAQEVPFHCLARAAYAYCLYNRTRHGPK
jgi:hypothetical protein